MPLYDYKCQAHGVFHALVAMNAAGEASACPQCGQLSSRVILVAPSILDMAPEKRRARETNERAAHEPRYGNHESERDRGCCHHDKHKPQLFYTAEGNKMFPSARPWMISH